MTGPPLWMRDAACVDIDVQVFFGAKDGGRYVRKAASAVAKKICEDCPVTVDCLKFAMAREPNVAHAFGVWGGLTPRERHKKGTAA